jgi:hypothetical protein
MRLAGLSRRRRNLAEAKDDIDRLTRMIERMLSESPDT